MPERDIQAMISERAEEGDFLVLPENWEVIGLLSLSSACWRYGQDGRFQGMHYADVEAAANWNGISDEARRLLPIAVNAILQG